LKFFFFPQIFCSSINIVFGIKEIVILKKKEEEEEMTKILVWHMVWCMGQNVTLRIWLMTCPNKALNGMNEFNLSGRIII
jgi:hypothetical protein